MSSSIIIRSRVGSILSKSMNIRSKFLSSGAFSEASKKESILGSQSIVSDLPPPEAAEVVENGGKKSPWRFLTYGIAGSLTVASAGAGYATYGNVKALILVSGLC